MDGHTDATEMSSKLIQMCATLLGQRHLVNAYEMHAEWLIEGGRDKTV